MRLLVLSLDFQRAPLDLRERLTFSEPDLPSALLALYTSSSVFHEVAILSTCNRVAVFAATPTVESAAEATGTFLETWHHLSRHHFESYLSHHHDLAAARYLLRVAAGLESLVPGEMQVLGQVRTAGEVARETGTLGPRLAALFNAAVRCGRRARNETAIARRAVSISHAAVALAVEHFGDLAGKIFLLVGSGKMGEVAARQLHDAGAQHFIVANRSLQRACTVARHYGGTPVILEEMPNRLAHADAVIACTAAPHIVLREQHITAALAARRSPEPLLLIDLAVPRDIDPVVASLPSVRLYDIDSLQAVAERNLALRKGERAAVEAIVEEELAAFDEWVRTRSVVPTISRLRQNAELIRQAEVDKAMRRLSQLGDREREIIDAMTRGIVNKLLHEPTIRLKETAGGPEGWRYEQAVYELFGLENEHDGHTPPNGRGQGSNLPVVPASQESVREEESA